MTLIDWDRVAIIAKELQRWMNENNYEIIDIQRAIAHLNYTKEDRTFKEEATKND